MTASNFIFLNVFRFYIDYHVWKHLTLFGVFDEDSVTFSLPFFKPPDFRTKKLRMALCRSKLFNLTCNSINALAEPDEPKLQNKFLNGFKNRITDYLLTIQSTGDIDWNIGNFLLYNV